MKRVLMALSVLCTALPCMAENKIKMVTYFPVPYVAYSKINASKQLDVGLTSSCEMNLGCEEAGSLGLRPLQATSVNLNRGKLDLNTAAAVKSTNVTLGSGSGEANIDFAQNLRLGTLNNGYSLEAADMTVDELKLFASHMLSGGEKFPSCASTGASGAPQISWQKVKLKKSEEVYLVCGNPGDTACEPTNAGREQYTDNCPSGQTGTVTYTWDYAACKYNESSTCKGCTWKYKRWDDYPYDAVRNGVAQNAIYCPDGSDVEKYKRWSKGEMTRTEYVRWVCSPVVPNLGGAQVWIAQYDSTNPYRICTQVDNPPVPTSEKDLCIMESSFCNAYPDQHSDCPYRSVSLYRAVCE